MLGNTPTGNSTPQAAPYFLANAWNTADRDRLKEELTRAIVEDPEVSSKANVSVDPKFTGKKVESIRIVGAVGSDKDRQRVEEIVKVNTRDEVSVVNELTVKS